MLSQRQRKAAIGLSAALTLFAFADDATAAPVTYTDFNAFQAAASNLTIDSFDAAPWASFGAKTQGLANLGVSWRAGNQLFAFNSTSHSAPWAITSNDGTLGGSEVWDWIEAVLPANVTAVGGWITSFNQLHTTELLAYDAQDNLLGSASLGVTGSSYTFLGLTTDTAIAKIRIASTNVTNPVGDDFALDDFSFGGTPAAIPIPEPSALALLGAGALAVLFGRRRKTISAGSSMKPTALDRRLLSDIGIERGVVLSVVPEGGLQQLRHAPLA